MRKEFFEQLHSEMAADLNIVFVTADLGYGFIEPIQRDFPDRFINVQAAEQAMILVCVGLALKGKIPVCYTISPFLLRAYEQIALYIEHEQIPVIMVGSGRGKDYLKDGVSHWEREWPFKNIHAFYPVEDWEAMDMINDLLKMGKPYYINLKR